MEIMTLREHPELLEEFIAFFSKHWHLDALHRDCMTSCLHTDSPLPQWYLLKDGQTTVGGAGLVPNDFVARMDLWPWFCSLYIEEPYRGHAYGSRLIDYARRDCQRLGFRDLYLITDHIGLYEKYGFTFIGMTADVFEPSVRLYHSPVPAL